MSISTLAGLFGVRALAVKEWHVDENAPSKVIIEFLYYSGWVLFCLVCAWIVQ